MSCLIYNETVILIDPDIDDYGSEQMGESASVPAIFGQRTGWAHGSNQTAVTSDAVAYLDPTNVFVSGHANRLEGMLLVAQLFGVSAPDAWYRITEVSVGRDSLLCNDIDTIQVNLKKTTEIAGVS